MDTTKRNQPNEAQDSSDDLIAELARLVAQDARSSSANNDAYRREARPETPRQVEPQFTQDVNRPAADAPARITAAPQADESRRAEVTPIFAFEGGAEGSGQSGGKPGYDAGSDDPIAQLISDAELDEMRADAEAEAREAAQAVNDIPASPIPEREEPSAGGSAFSGLSLAGERWSPPQPGGQRPNEQPAVPQAPQSTERDPLKDIEALIGEAARVDASGEGLSSRRVRSSFLSDEPEQSENESTRDAVSAAEATILAAAAATDEEVRAVQEEQRAREMWEPEPAPQPQPEPEPAFFPAVDRMDAPQVQPRYEEPAEADYADYGDEADMAEEDAPRKRRLPPFLIPAIAGAALFVMIGGVYFTFFTGPEEPGEAPVLSAEGGPLRQEAPEVASNSAASESVVFNELSGNTANAAEETLVSRDQTGGVTGGEVSSLIMSEEGGMELANRPVRTVTVRPDGSIVNTEDSVAGSNVLPVERPDVPEVPSSSMTSDPIGEAIAMAMAEQGGNTQSEAGGAVDPASLMASATAGVEADAANAGTGTTGADGAGQTGQTDAPLPIPRPESLNASGAAQQTQTAATTPAAPAAQPEAAPSDAGNVQPQAAANNGNVAAWVQLSSQRSEEVARAGIPELQSRYGALFNGAELDVSRVDLGDRGIYYRVRLPQPTVEDATATCNAIRGQGGDCFVLNN